MKIEGIEKERGRKEMQWMNGRGRMKEEEKGKEVKPESGREEK